MIFAPGCFSSIELGEQRRDEVAGTNSPVSSMKKQRSASPSKPTPSSAFSSSTLPITNSRFSGQQRVRLVVREASVGLEEVGDGIDREPLEDGRQHRAGHPVRRVDHDAQRLTAVGVDEGQDLLDVAREDISSRTCPGD